MLFDCQCLPYFLLISQKRSNLARYTGETCCQSFYRIKKKVVSLEFFCFIHILPLKHLPGHLAWPGCKLHYLLQYPPINSIFPRKYFIVKKNRVWALSLLLSRRTWIYLLTHYSWTNTSNSSVKPHIHRSHLVSRSSLVMLTHTGSAFTNWCRVSSVIHFEMLFFVCGLCVSVLCQLWTCHLF